MTTLKAVNHVNAVDSQVGLKAAFSILDKWRCPQESQKQILGMRRSTFFKYRGNPASARLTDDQVERISYILNIHAALRSLFDNPANVYGFMSMANDNPFFNGKSPLDIVATGQFGALYETFKRIDSLRGAQW